jgi:hypothetical protein
MNTVQFCVGVAIVGTLSALDAGAQKPSRFYVGLDGGAHMSRLSGEFTSYNTKVSPGLGWSGGAVGAFDIVPRLSIQSGLGVVLDQTSSSTVISQAVYQTGPTAVDASTQYLWAQGSLGFFYKPVLRKSFSLLGGGSFSGRRIIYSKVETSIGGYPDEFYQTSELSDWNYFLSPQLGAEFSLAGNSKVLCLVEYNLGLKGVYRPREQFPDPNFDYTYVPSSYKLRSWGARVAWIWPLAKSQQP